MPKGVPKNGFRKTKNWKKRLNGASHETFETPINKNETDQEISARIRERFDVLEILANATIAGDSRALIVSGPAGLGKSFTVEECLLKYDPNQLNHKIIKGYVRATGLYKMLWQHREQGQVLVFDDADSVFFDDAALNLLKAVCDTTERRVVSWLSEAKFVDEDSADLIPNHFEFQGSIIFITNHDFDAMIERKHKFAEHMKALMSRSHYVDLSMKNVRDYLIRIKQVMDDGLLAKHGLSKDAEAEIISFLEQNASKLREQLSLRSAIKLADLRRSNRSEWKRVARVTFCRQ